MSDSITRLKAMRRVGYCRPGPKPRDPSTTRVKTLTLKVTPGEYAQIMRAHQKRNLNNLGKPWSLSDFLRKQALMTRNS